ncbi:Acyltransferase calJ [Pseudocercospora fuligena]|uniref:Acyltransferase calJ n=1 Tax=Pseudocercospora fuligena TaxID=685502 RepID=A0A8H6VEF5_9PEZI|nr:Acyltransferase calJ [Pseudocercospora fuligena]
MADFNTLLTEYTNKEEPVVHGVLTKCVDKNGKEIYSKTVGWNSIESDAQPLREDAVLKMASATKLMASIALLQCIEQGLIGLDEPVTRVLPELDNRQIISKSEAGELAYTPASKPITPRHLLSHMSGMAYTFLTPLLMAWEATGAKSSSNKIAEKMGYPLLFEPGNGWVYGVSLDWAGLVVARINNTTLENYMIENIWKRVGRTAPFPTFHLSHHPEYRARLMKAAQRKSSRKLEPWDYAYGDNDEDEEGGHGLVLTMADYTAVLADLVSDSPKLLKPSTIDLMYEPQLAKDSPGIPMLMRLKPAWDMVAGPVKEEYINHGLGGLLVQGETPEIAQPANILCWGGASNIVWWICREKGVAGFFATQIHPFSDNKVKQLVNAWKKDFWPNYQG